MCLAHDVVRRGMDGAADLGGWFVWEVGSPLSFVFGLEDEALAEMLRMIRDVADEEARAWRFEEFGREPELLTLRDREAAVGSRPCRE